MHSEISRSHVRGRKPPLRREGDDGVGVVGTQICTCLCMLMQDDVPKNSPTSPPPPLSPPFILHSPVSSYERETSVLTCQPSNLALILEEIAKKRGTQQKETIVSRSIRRK